jgi:lysophospholipase L1-like esterase
MNCAKYFLFIMLMHLGMSGAALALEQKTLDKTTRGDNVMKVELLGASIGEQWRLDEFAQRTNRHEFKLSARQEYDFDKSKLLKSAIASPDKPDAVIIKECAAYFPDEVQEYQQRISRWVQQAKAAGIVPIVATTVPVTERMPTWLYMKQLVKRYVLRRNYVDYTERLAKIWEYNDWIREFSLKNGVALLDLERALRVSDTNRSLSEKYAKDDGLHINAAAYQVLDGELTRVLDQVSHATGRR